MLDNMKRVCYIKPDVREQFGASAGDLEFWLDAEVGRQLFREKAGREIRVIDIAGQRFFLKRSGIESIVRSLPMVFFGLRPCSGALRELRMLRCLKESEFDVMEPVAWGEKSASLTKHRGFLLVRNVDGVEAKKYLKSASPGEQRLLLEKTGELTGRLHAAGFYQAIRLKDLIWSENRLVQIDRETLHPWKTRFSRKRCINALERGIRRTFREEHQLTLWDTRHFFKQYVHCISSCWNITPSALFRRVLVPVIKKHQKWLRIRQTGFSSNGNEDRISFRHERSN